METFSVILQFRLLDAERKQLGLARKKRSTETKNNLELDQYNRHPAVSIETSGDWLPWFFE